MISCPAYLDQTTVPRDLDTLQRPQPQVCDGLCIGHLEARWAVFVWKEIFVEDFDDEEILRSTLSLDNALIYLRPPITASTQTSAQADAEKRSEVSVERRRTDTTGDDQILECSGKFRNSTGGAGSPDASCARHDPWRRRGGGQKNGFIVKQRRAIPDLYPISWFAVPSFASGDGDLLEVGKSARPSAVRAPHSSRASYEK